MDKIEKIKSLSKLKDEGHLSEAEFIKLKSDILAGDLTKDKVEYTSEIKVNVAINEPDKPRLSETGSLRIVFKGMWFLFDVETYIYMNDKLVSKESTKRGFDVKIPLTSDQDEVFMKLKILANSTSFKVDVNPCSQNLVTLNYSRTLGKYSSKFKYEELS